MTETQHPIRRSIFRRLLARLESVQRSSESAYRADIDGLRALAVLSVVAFHAFPTLAPGGFVGVDVFFVISGFLITRIILSDLYDGQFSISRFYGRRVRRIFPALAVVLLASMAAGWFVLLPTDYSELARQTAAGSLFGANFLFWREAGYFDGNAGTKPLLHLWSLGVEEQFYIVWPLLLYVTMRLRLKALPVLLGILGFSFLINMLGVVRWPTASFYLPFSRFWELALGGLLAQWIVRTSRTQPNPHVSIGATSADALRSGLSLIGLALIVIAVFAFDQHKVFPGWRALLPTIGAGLLIAAGDDALINRTILKNRLLVRVGLISYPLYMWHWPMLSFLHIQSIEPPKTAIVIAVVSTSILLAWLTYKFIELPIRCLKAGKKRDHVTLALVAILVAELSAAVVVIYKDGFPTRFPEVIRILDGKKIDGTWVVNNWRQGRCWLYEGDQFHQECTDVEPKNAPLLALWGDSHAAALYPGLRALQMDHQFRLAQYTLASCPPILGYDEPNTPKNSHCAVEILKAFELLKLHKPDIVVLQGAWWAHSQGSAWEQNLVKLERTIETLREAGFKRIILMGSYPVWPALLTKVLRDAAITDSLHRIPTRTNLGLAETLPQIDAQLQQIARRKSAEFLSPREFLCNTRGCLTRVGETVEDLMTWDDAHLTLQSSQYLVNVMATELLGFNADKTVTSPSR